MRTIRASLPSYARRHLEPLLPRYIEAAWYEDIENAVLEAAGSEIGWYDYFPAATAAIEAAPALRWVFTLAAGVELFPLALLRDRGISLSNGSGLNAAVVADYAVMGVLVGAKHFHEVVRAQDRREWLHVAPGLTELHGTRALILGYGSIGVAVGWRLSAFGVEVIGVRSKPNPTEGILGPEDWRPRLGEFDWIIIAAPATPATLHLVSRPEIAAMKPTAWLINVGRGNLIAHDPLREALQARTIGGAFLDVTDPEPLPADDPLWTTPNAVITMHLSGRSQSGLNARAARLFVANLERYMRGAPLENLVDLHGGGY